MNAEALRRSDAEWRARALSCPECAAVSFAECNGAQLGSLLGVHPGRVVEALLRPAEVEASLASRRFSPDPRLRAAAARAQRAAARHGIAAVAAGGGAS